MVWKGRQRWHATKVYPKLQLVVDNESHEVSQTEGETQDTICRQKVKPLKTERKPVVFAGYTSRSIVANKACFTCV